MVGHADECVLIHYTYGNPLACAEQAHTSRVAGVELTLSCLNAAGAAQERVGVHHHFIAGYVGEVEVVHLVKTGDMGIHKRLRGVVKTSPHDVKELIQN